MSERTAHRREGREEEKVSVAGERERRRRTPNHLCPRIHRWPDRLSNSSSVLEMDIVDDIGFLIFVGSYKSLVNDAFSFSNYLKHVHLRTKTA
jgi:hypothetical protein